eukprot:3148459-Amphidinium_carterae.1
MHCGDDRRAFAWMALAEQDENGREFKTDRAIVLAALEQNGHALQYAAEELRGDREIVQKAVGQNGRAL